MKKLITLIFALFLAMQTIHAQVGFTRSEITSKYGNTFFKTGVSTLGEAYIIYQVKDSTATSGSFTKTMGFYFKKVKDGPDYCNEQLIMEPKEELKKWVDYFNSKYEKISKTEYKDTANKIIFKVSIINEQCAIRIWYE